MYKKNINQNSNSGRSSFGGKRSGYNRKPNNRNTGSRFSGNKIHHSRFICKADPIIEHVPYVPINKFKDFKINDIIKSNITEKGYVNPTPIQDSAIPFILKGRDVVGIANTGTGKTAAFLIPLLNSIDTNRKWVQALILAPTRELVNQIFEDVMLLTKHYMVKTVCLFGGASPVLQKKNLAKWANIIVATPWRLLDFMNQKVVDVVGVDFFVLDEVDKMLDMWFIRDIKKIRAAMRSVKQTYTFSATVNHDIKEIINEHVPSYEFIKVWDTITVDKINHSYVSVQHENKLINLVHIIQTHMKDKVLVFTGTKRNTKVICEILAKSWIDAGMLNWDMTQWKRQWTINRFKMWEVNVLVTTDVAARWLNLDNVWLVVNFDVPKESESYIHRIGRTWRAGASGKAIMLVAPEETWLMSEIEKVHKTRIPKSEHRTITETKWKYSEVHLDKSTDKFGKWKPNPNKARWRSFWSTWSFDRKPFGSNDRKPFAWWEKKPFGWFRDRDDRWPKQYVDKSDSRSFWPKKFEEKEPKKYSPKWWRFVWTKNEKRKPMPGENKWPKTVKTAYIPRWDRFMWTTNPNKRSYKWPRPEWGTVDSRWPRKPFGDRKEFWPKKYENRWPKSYMSKWESRNYGDKKKPSGWSKGKFMWMGKKRTYGK